MKRCTARGFTLIELMVVVVVIGILAAITMRIAGNASQRSAYAQTINEMEHIEQWLEEYYNLYGEYPDVNGSYNMMWENPDAGSKPPDWPFIMAQAAIYSPDFNQQSSLPQGLCWWFANRSADHMAEYKDEIGIGGGTSGNDIDSTDIGFEYGEIAYSNGVSNVKDAWGREYRYDVSSNLESYTLYSVGPDGDDGTPDDLGRGSYTE